MSMLRAAAEIEPKAAICSRSSILPGPILPSGSRFTLRLSDGIGFTPGSPRRRVILPDLFHLCRPLQTGLRADNAARRVGAVEGDRFDDGKHVEAGREIEDLRGLSCNSSGNDLAVAVDEHIGDRTISR